ncbi:MAG: threonylcarbamoyladenosine tRNA methylthiotransferase MtaB [Chloroflexota bacterium]|nr:threonylcarbamoyladenosine tRNA methylthiotransferase MtaB [Chloroflexota bacterium]
MSLRPVRAALTALGCKVNYAEMAELAGRLAAAGIEVVGEDDPADVRVLNSCAVTMQADATTRQRISRLRRADPQAHLVLTGCSVDANPGRYPALVDSVVANADKAGIADRIIELVAARGGAAATATATPPRRSRAFLKVQDGCDHRCTYCIVWRARGGVSRSLPLDEVLARVDAALDAGHRELVLTGVDLGSWGHERGERLSTLVAAVLERIGGARLRLSSVNANDITSALAELNAHPRLCPHWHVPLQSGSDAVLRAMHRGYRGARYRRVVEQLRAADPHTELTTDVMVAFPGETEDDHAATLAMVADAGFLHCHTFRWSPRPDTPAVLLEGRLDEETARRRSREVRRAAARTGLAARRRAVGRRLEVVWERVEEGEARGLSEGWHTVVAVPGPATVPGALEEVLIDAVEGDVLRATLPGP